MKRETASARLCIFVVIESDPRAADTDAPLSSTNSFISEGQPAEWTAAPRAPCESELSGTSRAENRYLVAPLGPGFCRVPALVPAAWGGSHGCDIHSCHCCDRLWRRYRRGLLCYRARVAAAAYLRGGFLAKGRLVAQPKLLAPRGGNGVPCMRALNQRLLMI